MHELAPSGGSCMCGRRGADVIDARSPRCVYKQLALRIAFWILTQQLARTTKGQIGTTDLSF